MKESQFRKFCDIAYSKAGILLKDGKQALVGARVAKRLRILNISSVGEYLEFLEGEDNGNEMINFLDAISTNFTHFMREEDHFKVLADVVARWYEGGQRRFRFWSAASSSGEEPYSMAITILRALKDKDVDFKILATDISTQILQKAKEGVYPEASLAPFSKQVKLKYFNRLGERGKDGVEYEVKPEVKKHVLFKRLNLSTPPFPMQGPMDVVFCRNVMIYFDNRVRQGLVSEIERLLKPGGNLMVGHTETLTGISTGFKTIKPSLYEKQLGVHAPSRQMGA